MTPPPVDSWYDFLALAFGVGMLLGAAVSSWVHFHFELPRARVCPNCGQRFLFRRSL